MQLWGGALAAAVTAVLIWSLLQSGLAFKILDHPNSRSLHTAPTPRIGGLCVVIAIVLSEATFGAGSLWPVIAAAVALSVLSFADDLWSLPAAVRIVFHVAAAAVLLLIDPPAPFLLIIPLTIAVVWATNLYNFMDGLDGLAGGMTMFGFGAYAVAASIGHSAYLGMLSTVIAASAAAFLVFNTSPARIFLGDAGAIPLGFLAAILGYDGFKSSVWGWWFPLLVFSPFLADATVTLIRRLFAGEKVWQAHRTHYYQRMAQSRIGHLRTALCWYVPMAVAAASAIVIRRVDTAAALLTMFGFILFYVVAMVVIDRNFDRVGR